jgi:glucokinase
LDNQKMITLWDVPAEKNGKKAIIGAGSGLGTVSMLWNEEKQSYTGYPSEAGTGDFPPLDIFELDLMRRVQKLRNFATSHWAFLVSQPAIQHIYQSLQDMNYENCASNKQYPDALAILDNAKNDACCAKTAELFYKYYARFVYNFVWTMLPFGGIYLVGETAADHPEMLQSLFLPPYFECVENKRSLLQRIPVYLVKKDPTIHLYGVAQYFLSEKKELLTSNSFLNKLQNKIGNYWNILKNKLRNYY